MEINSKSKLKVCIFFYVNNNGSFKLGGAERRLTRIFDKLAGYGYETHIILMTNSINQNIVNEYQKYSESNSVKINLVNSHLTLFKYMIDKRFDWICYTDSYRKMFPFLLFGILLRSNRLMLNVTTYLSELNFNNLFQKYLFLIVVRLSNRIDVLYPHGYNIMSTHFSNKIVSLTPGVFTNTELFKPQIKEKKIVFLSSLIDIKNPILFFDSILGIKDILISNRYQVVICGSGPLYETLNQRIKINNIEHLILLKGNVNSEDELPSAEVFVSLQKYNNYPSQALLEAISSGCYIIASDEGDTSVIVKSSFGTLCELNTISVSNAIQKYILMNEVDKNEFKNQARKFALENFNIEKTVEYYNEFFRK